ncbi:MAG: DUF6261 family protein [Prevotellaceae bacterium]|jgi:hypothetical protein|nr:DUF6261 family protein [Prevotellaceae bacterium]
MVKFRVLLFKFLPNEAHYKFFDRAWEEVAAAGSSVQSALGTLSGELNDWFVKETACVEWVYKSALTASIADAERHLNKTLLGLSAQVRGARYDSNPVVASAAKRLYIMLKSYGYVSRKPYLQEIGATKAIIVHLKDDMAPDVQSAGVSRWTMEIQTALNDFVNLFEQREAQMLNKPEQGFPEVRRGIENVWRRIVVLVNAGASLNTSPEFAALINRLNPEIKYLNGEFHRVRHSIAAAELSPIEKQPYTGKPCTPVPEVLYVTPKETLRLVLGKDFNVTYKNNVNAGNAECTIHGKGGYRGLKTVTFIIVR